MNEKEVRVGDVHVVDFVKNRNGGKPVCRVEGIVGFIYDDDIHPFCCPGSTWIVEVVKVKEKNVEVMLVDKVRSPRENERLLRQKLKEIAKQEREKHEMLHKRRN